MGNDQDGASVIASTTIILASIEWDVKMLGKPIWKILNCLYNCSCQYVRNIYERNFIVDLIISVGDANQMWSHGRGSKLFIIVKYVVNK